MKFRALVLQIKSQESFVTYKESTIRQAFTKNSQTAFSDMYKSV